MIQDEENIFDQTAVNTGQENREAKEEGVKDAENTGVLKRLFVCFARVCFCPFSLPLGVDGWLRCVIVAYPGPFY